MHTSPPTAVTKKIPVARVSHNKCPKLPVETRVKGLLARMTPAEKAAPMMCVWQDKARKLVDDKGDSERGEMKSWIS